MTEFKIPNPGPVPTEASELTLQEIADLAPSKRNIVLYEREIEYLKGLISYLQDTVSSLQTENSNLLAAERLSIDDKIKLGVARRSKLEMYVAFAIGTFLMAIGGGLLGSFPVTDSNIPWQHAVGWCCIILGATFGLLSRTIIQFVLHRLPRIAEDWMQ
jgi:hypothetical protein